MQTRGLDGFSAGVWRHLEGLEGMDRSSETSGGSIHGHVCLSAVVMF